MKHSIAYIFHQFFLQGKAGNINSFNDATSLLRSLSDVSWHGDPDWAFKSLSLKNNGVHSFLTHPASPFAVSNVGDVCSIETLYKKLELASHRDIHQASSDSEWFFRTNANANSADTVCPIEIIRCTSFFDFYRIQCLNRFLLEYIDRFADAMKCKQYELIDAISVRHFSVGCLTNPLISYGKYSICWSDFLSVLHEVGINDAQIEWFYPAQPVANEIMSLLAKTKIEEIETEPCGFYDSELSCFNKDEFSQLVTSDNLLQLLKVHTSRDVDYDVRLTLGKQVVESNSTFKIADKLLSQSTFHLFNSDIFIASTDLVDEELCNNVEWQDKVSRFFSRIGSYYLEEICA